MREFLSIRWHICRYLVRNWRCTLLGHTWGKETHYYEDIYHYESLVHCERPRCEAYANTWHVLEGGQTDFGRELERKQERKRVPSGGI